MYGDMTRAVPTPRNLWASIRLVDDQMPTGHQSIQLPEPPIIGGGFNTRKVVVKATRDLIEHV